MEIRLKITKHARFKMLELGINKNQIKEAIKRGSKFRQTEGLLAKYQWLAVAYRKIGKDYYKIKTVMER